MKSYEAITINGMCYEIKRQDINVNTSMYEQSYNITECLPSGRRWKT